MQRQWRRTETRAVRPFLTISQCIDSIQLRLLSSQTFSDDTAFVLRQEDLGNFKPEFRFDINRDSIEVLWPNGSKVLELVIRATDLRLRRSQMIFKQVIDRVPESWEIPQDIFQRLAWTAGVKFTVALVLVSSRTPIPGEPFLRGHWVARKDFSVGLQVQKSIFPIERWTANDFVKHGLPPDSAFWIDFITDDFNRRFEESEEAFRVCFRADVYDALAESQNTVAGKAVMSILFSEITADVLWMGMRSLGLGDELKRGGVINDLVVKILKATNTTQEALSKMARNHDRTSLRAHVQATLATRRDIVKIKAES
jgi:hypothetical protein